MAASSIVVETKAVTGVTSGLEHIDASESFSWQISTNITTLSSNTASLSSSPEGFLYVPQLQSGSACSTASSKYVPQNVTRRANVPNQPPNIIAIAPWLTPDCVQAYLRAANGDNVRAFMFYLPDNGDTAPPSTNDPVWSLGDGGQWKSTNVYPVFAVSTDKGQQTIQQLSLYSGNLSTAPHSDYLASRYDPQTPIKLYATISFTLTTGLPSLWIFLVIIVAVLISVVGIVSAVMHLIQRRRRRDLQRRIANGEVDLESVGIKRLMVPQTVLTQMPLYNYKKVDPTAPSPQDVETTTVVAPKSGTPEKGTAPVQADKPTIPVNHFDQPTCAICLDDFIPDESQVRELPCGHIFHPECVDHFLTRVSSLCPLCKKSALPKGYCPAVITNMMVRRERILRRERQRAIRAGITPLSPGQATETGALARLRRLSRLGDIEMNQRTADAEQGNGATGITPTVSNQAGQLTTEERAARARQRASELLGPNAAPRDPDAEDRAPAWRRGLRKIFPAR